MALNLRKPTAWLSASLVAAAIALTGPSAASATCYGYRYDYYSDPSLTDIVGSKISCPGFPDQHDEDANGNYVVTPWYTTEMIVCPCGSGGGGGTGGGNPNDEPGGG